MGPEATDIHWGWAQVWTPLVTRSAAATRSYHQYNTYALLRPDATFDMAQADMARITRELGHEYPGTNRGWVVRMQRYQDTLVSTALRRTLALLWAAVGAVLLIGCVNLAHLTLTQSVVREGEVAVRSALGGSRRRLSLQLLTESAALGIVGGALGIGVAYAGIAALRAMLPAFSAPGRSLPPASMLAMDGRVLAFTCAAGLLSGVVFGLVPAVTATRVNLQRFVTQAGTTVPARRRLRGAMVVLQSALAFVLLTATAILSQQLLQLLRTEIGRDPDTVVTAQLPMTQAQVLAAPELRAIYLDRILNAAAATPGVADAALASVLPMMGGGSELPFHPDTSAAPFEIARAPIGFFKMVTPSYFDIVGQPVVRGRSINEADTAASPHVVLINESLAHAYFPGVDPIGRAIHVPRVVAAGQASLGPLERWQVIGIVPNERVRSLTDRPDMPGMYVPLAQSTTRHPAIVVRASADTSGLPRLLARAIAGVNNDQALTDVRTLSEIRNDYALGERQRTWLVLLFSVAALLLAGIGVYGVSAAVVAQERRAIGIRSALGAPAAHEIYRVVARAMALAVAGLAIGVLVVLAGLAATAALAGGPGPDPFEAMGLAAIVLALVTVAGSAVPAWRAGQVSPLEAMRT
jgi:putative ABC transport system permease protein